VSEPKEASYCDNCGLYGYEGLCPVCSGEESVEQFYGWEEGE